MAAPSPRVASRSLQTRHAVRALRRALVFIAIAIGVVVITAGCIMWAVDRENFPDPGEGMWWAVQTATTIGYGDVVPTTAAGRAVASLVMILGVAFVSILTAFIVSDLVARHAERQQKEIEQEGSTSPRRSGGWTSGSPASRARSAPVLLRSREARAL